jgi:hypothetical protein
MLQATTIPIDYKTLYEASQLEVMQLKLRLAQLEKMVYGSRHERFVPDNGTVALDEPLPCLSDCTPPFHPR